MKASFRPLCILLILLCGVAQAQDERFYRKIFTGELFKPTDSPKDHKFKVQTRSYLMDLNRDGEDEGIIVENIDGLDYLRIVSQYGVELFKLRLDTMGGNSYLYKIQLKKISSSVDALVLHFYEGAIDYLQFEATARLYFVTIEERDLKKIYSYKGPHFFHEKEKIKNQYTNKVFTVNVVDYNKDGTREISTSYNQINRIYFYRGGGNWQKL